MKEILKQNKDMLLNFFLAGAIISIILSGLLSKIGFQADNLIQNTDYEHYIDAAQLKTVAALPKPILKCRQEKQWKSGSAVVIHQAFQATDYTGQELSIQVLQIKNEAGTDVTARYQESTDTIIFDKAGCYYFKLKAIDNNKKVTTEEIALVIDAMELEEESLCAIPY